jgi:hypothetical protein
VIKFVSSLWQVSGFLGVHRFPPPIKLSQDITEILLKMEFINDYNHTLYYQFLLQGLLEFGTFVQHQHFSEYLPQTKVYYCYRLEHLSLMLKQLQI